MSDQHRHPKPGALPVVEEQLDIHREVVETGSVRVRLRSSQHTEVVQAPSRRRGIRVERIDRNTPVAERMEVWQDGDVMVVPVYEEVMVKQLILKEELRLIPTILAQDELLAVELKSETPVFERRDELGQWHEVSIDEVEAHSRRNHIT